MAAKDFNPRPLAGATLPYRRIGQRRFHFNPRPLAGATPDNGNHIVNGVISIHAPLRGRLDTGSQTGHS